VRAAQPLAIMPSRLERLQATIQKVSRVVNGAFGGNSRAKEASDSEGEDAAAISPRENILRRSDSVLIMVAHKELQREFPERRFSPRLFFDHPTIEGIAQELCESDLEETQDPEGSEGGTIVKGLGWSRPNAEALQRARPFTQLMTAVDGDDPAAQRALSKEGLYEPAGVGRCFRLMDGMECLLLPAARACIGSKSGPGAQRPQHEVELSSFLMDVEPVSVGAFARFLNAAQPSQEALQDWCLLLEGDERACHLPLCVGDDGAWEARPGVLLSWPMILVSWYGANAYSLWAHARDWRQYRSAACSFLPSEAQWEYAARGAEPAPWPWGSAPAEPGMLNVCWDPSALDASSLNSMPLPELPLVPVNVETGLSPFGLRHMAGNVWQWCRDAYDPGFYSSAAASLPDAWNQAEGGLRSERGGSWVGPAGLARSSYRRGRTAEAKGRCLGFRCVGLASEACC